MLQRIQRFFAKPSATPSEMTAQEYRQWFKHRGVIHATDLQLAPRHSFIKVWPTPASRAAFRRLNEDLLLLDSDPVALRNRAAVDGITIVDAY